jgi:hypothetical protein
LLVLTAVFALPVAAQVDTGTIEVNARGPEGEAVSGVAILVVNAKTGVRRATVSDARGLAIIPALEPGAYEVSVSLAGFAPAEQDVVIRLGQTAKVAFSMSVLVTASISVTAEVPMVDVYKSDTSTNVTPEQIRDLPVPSRDFQKLAFIAPGVQRERGGFRFIGGSALIGSSGNASETAIVIDGVDFTDQVLGLARASFSQDAIGEFKVVNNRFDTEIGSSAGGALSVVTKSGTNAVHGSVFGFYRSDALRALGELEEGTQDYGRYQLGFTLGGPISRDTTHYFLSYEHINEDSITFFRPQGAFADLAEDLPVPISAHLALAGIDHQISAEQKLGLKLVYEKFGLDNFRVGGTADESAGMQLNRENWNLVAGHDWIVADNKVNSIRFQIGRKFFEEPANSDRLAEYFTYGSTLMTGTNIVGDQEMTGDYISLGDTFNWYLGGMGSGHELKLGASITSIEEKWYWPLYPQGLMMYVTDSRAVPYLYYNFVGNADLEVDTTVFGIFAQDHWRLSPDFSLSFGLRYDYDTDGNNPDFDDSPLVGPRSVDSDNIQPRLGFTWDIGGNGATVIRGGAGIFVGRYLLVPAFVERQQNGTTGVVLSRLNGFLLGLPPDFWLDPNDPENSGLLLPPNVSLLQDNLEAPEALQTSLGFTQRLGTSGLYLDVEGIYSEGENEIVLRDTNWRGNDDPGRINPLYTAINKYTNEGHSRYKALMVSLNGTLRGGHIVACNLTYADKKNISDDFSPAATSYPSDSADIQAEWGRARSDERWRAALTGVFRLPANFTIAPVFRYGSGQPWNRIVSYDRNGDTRFSDRLDGVARNAENGPSFSTVDLRVTWSLDVGVGSIDFIAEAFNLLNRVNYYVDSVDNAEFLSGPTLADPDIPYVENPNFGTYAATLPPREIQLGIRYSF